MSEQELPFVSVIMPVRNEAAFIERSLGAVLAQDYPADRMEVIVADGMSEDGTRSIIENLKIQVPNSNGEAANLKVIDNPKRIVSTGLNRALAVAQGEIIVRVDGHTIIEPDYIKECVAALQRTKADNVGGRMNAIGAGTMGHAIALATSSPFGVGGARFHYSDKEEWVDTVYLGAWPRRIFDTIGGFDEEMVRNQDDEFNYRLRRHGGSIRLVPSIKSSYFCRNSLSTLWNQYFHYGFWKVRVLQKHPRQMKPRQFVPGLFVLALLLMTLLSVFTHSTFVLLLGTLLSYAAAAFGYSLMLARFHGPSNLIVLPIVFVVLHVSYGAGFLLAVMRFCMKAFWPAKRGKARVTESLSTPL